MTEKQLKEQIAKLEKQLEEKKAELQNLTAPYSVTYKIEYHYSKTNLRTFSRTSYYDNEQTAKKAMNEKIKKAKVFSQYHATGCAYLTIEYKVKGETISYDHYMFVMGEQQ